MCVYICVCMHVCIAIRLKNIQNVPKNLFMFFPPAN